MTLPRLIQLTDYENGSKSFIDFYSIIAIRRLSAENDPDFSCEERTRIDYRSGGNRVCIMLVNELPEEIMAKGAN